jgi:hypothetical protein
MAGALCLQAKLQVCAPPRVAPSLVAPILLRLAGDCRVAQRAPVRRGRERQSKRVVLRQTGVAGSGERAYIALDQSKTSLCSYK